MYIIYNKNEKKHHYLNTM